MDERVKFCEERTKAVPCTCGRKHDHRAHCMKARVWLDAEDEYDDEYDKTNDMLYDCMG